MTFYRNRNKFSGFSAGIGRSLSGLGLSPNQWTAASLIPAIIAVYAFLEGMFIAAGLLFILSSFLDMVDGAVARHTGKASRRGAYLDTIVDRYVEFIMLFGIMLAALPGFIMPAGAWILLFLFGGMATTYAKAAAKEKELIGKGAELKGGLLERAERLLLLFAGIMLAAVNPVYLTYMIALLAALANVSALQRIRIALRVDRCGVSANVS